MITLRRLAFDSPLGPVHVVLRGRYVCAVDFADRWPVVKRRLLQRFGAVEWQLGAPARGESRGRGAHARLRRRFQAYFRGRVDALEGVPLDLGGTPFQQAVWRALLSVAPGTTTTYAALARAAGRPRAARAAGHATGLNPAALVVPCHRAIGSDGSLHGYAGGLPRKSWLLSHEAQALPRGARRRRTR